jgi:hypothetical protein
MDAWLYTHVLTCLLMWTNPRANDAVRMAELVGLAAEIADSGAGLEEAEAMVGVCRHLTYCGTRATRST